MHCERKEWGADWAKWSVAIVGAQLTNVLVVSLPLLMFGLVLALTLPMQLLLRVILDFHPPTEDR